MELVGSAAGRGETSKNNKINGVRYGALAAVAAASGRRTLAATLLEAEPVPRERVPLLLRLGDGARALDAALGSSDPDLISSVLLRPTVVGIGSSSASDGGEAAANAARFLQRAKASSAARAVLARAALDAAEAERVSGGGGEGGSFLPSPNSTLELKAVERVLGPSPAAALSAEAALSVAAGSASSAVAARRDGRGKAERAAGEAAARALEAAAAEFSKSGLNSSSGGSANFDVNFYASAASEGASLRRLQASLEASTGHAMLVGLSASETLLACLRVEEGGGGGGSGSSGATTSTPSSSSSTAAASRRVRAELRLSDRRWAWARLRSRVEARDWGGVEAMVVADAAALAAGGGAAAAKAVKARSSSSSSTSPLPAPLVVDIARMCRKGGASDASVLRLFARLPDDAAKVEALAAAGMRRDAQRVAARVSGGIGGGGWIGDAGGGASGGGGEDLLGRLQQGVLSFGRGLVGGGSGR